MDDADDATKSQLQRVQALFATLRATTAAPDLDALNEATSLVSKQQHQKKAFAHCSDTGAPNRGLRDEDEQRRPQGHLEIVRVVRSFSPVAYTIHQSLGKSTSCTANCRAAQHTRCPLRCQPPPPNPARTLALCLRGSTLAGASSAALTLCVTVADVCAHAHDAHPRVSLKLSRTTCMLRCTPRWLRCNQSSLPPCQRKAGHSTLIYSATWQSWTTRHCHPLKISWGVRKH